MAAKPKGPERPVQFSCGQLLHESWINSIQQNSWWIYVSHQVTALRLFRVTEKANTVFASMSNIEFVLFGQKVVQRMSKSLTTTSRER